MERRSSKKSMTDVKRGVFSAKLKEPLVCLLEMQFPCCLIYRFFCIKSKTKFKLQSKHSTFRADRWTVGFEGGRRQCYLELARKKSETQTVMLAGA